MAGSLEIWKAVGNKGHSTFNTNADVPILYTDTSNTNPGTAPIPIQSAPVHTTYSAEAWVYAKLQNAPANQIDNLRFWGPGSNRQDDFVVLWVGTSVSSAGVGNKNLASPRQLGAISSAAVFNGSSARAYTSPGDFLPWDPDTVLTTSGDTSTFLVLQLQVGSQAALGTLSNENTVMHFSYDES